MKAEIIAVGTEILLGQIVDTNSQFLAGGLAELGIDLYYTTTVGDNGDRLLAVLEQARQRSDLIITTGGLGPTEDDITREAVARLLGETPDIDQTVLEELKGFFSQRGIEMPPNNNKQATIIPSATFLPNPIGTAPGWWAEQGGVSIAVMPGPPREMQRMWQHEVRPRLERRAEAVILSRTLKTFGLSEGKVDELIAPLAASANPTLAVYAKTDGIQLRITAKAARPEAARELIARREAEVRQVLGEYVWGADADTPEGIIGDRLRERGLTLAVADGFSHGRLTQVIAGADGSDAFFRGGLVANSEAARTALGIPPGLAGTALAAATAATARQKLGAAIGLGLEGAPKPGEPSATEVAIAIDGGETGLHFERSYAGRADLMRVRAVYQALFDLARLLD